MTDDASSVVSDATRRLWGQNPVRRRGPAPTLTVAAIVEAALVIADADGLDAVSMTRVAQALRCSSTALYRHIDGKDELLALLIDRVAGEVAPPPPGADWQDGLRVWTRIQIDGVLAHPWILQLPLASAPLGPHRSGWIDAGLGIMRDLDLPLADKGQILNLLSLYLLAEARVQIELRSRTVTPFAELARDLGHLIEGEGLPQLTAALAEPPAADDSGELGLDLILQGVAARVATRVTPRATATQVTPQAAPSTDAQGQN